MYCKLSFQTKHPMSGLLLKVYCKYPTVLGAVEYEKKGKTYENPMFKT